MCRSHGTQSNASLKVAGFDRSFNRSSLAGFHRSLTVPGARVKIAIERTQPVESSTQLRRAGKYGLEPEEHHFVRATGPLNPLPLYFVDNVITTGNTIRAARAVLGWGTGLAYADASSPFNSRLRKVAKSPPQAEITH